MNAKAPAGDPQLASIRQRLWHGEVLRLLFSEDVGFDVWVEKYGNPPQCFFEGRPWPLEDFDEIVARIGDYLAQGDVKPLWNGHIPTKRDGALG